MAKGKSQSLLNNKNGERGEGDQTSTNHDQTSTLVSFAVFGCLIHISFSVILSGTQDILAGTHIPTSIILSVAMVPQFLLESIAPYFLKRIPHVVRVLIVFINAFVGFIIVAYVNHVYWKIASVGVVTSGSATGLISMGSILSYFSPSATSAFSTGCGIGIFAGTLYYTALTTWFCVSPNVTFVVLSPLSILFLVSYYIIIRNKDNKSTDSTIHKDVAYTKIEDKDTDEENDEDKHQEKGKKRLRRQSKNMTDDESLTRKEKMLVIAKLFSLTVFPTFLAFFTYYLSNQAVITTIAYKNAPFRPRDHYQYYIFALTSGEMIGRCHRSLLSLVCIGWNYAPSRKLLWIFSVIEISSLILLILESWYRFFPSVAFVISLCFLIGTVLGLLFDNMLVLLHVSFEGKQREFVMAYSMFPISAGLLSAAFLGFYVEPRLKEHCISLVQDSAYCFTRSNSLKGVTVGCRHY